MQGRNLKGVSTYYSKTCANTCVAAIVSNNFCNAFEAFFSIYFFDSFNKGFDWYSGPSSQDNSVTHSWEPEGHSAEFCFSSCVIALKCGSRALPWHPQHCMVLQRNVLQDNQTLDTGRQKRSYKKRSVSYSRHWRWSQRCRARKHKAPVKVTK